MKLRFDLGRVRTVEFGLAFDDGESVRVPVDPGVQKLITSMAQATWDALEDEGREVGPHVYDPGNKHANRDWLYLPANDPAAFAFADLQSASRLEVDGSSFARAPEATYYFARLTDERGRVLLALRKAAQFKTLLKARSRLIRWVDDSLTAAPAEVFKLDTDFDMLMDADYLHMLRPASFEQITKANEAICKAVGRNIEELARRAPEIDFDGLGDYATRRPRAARTIAAIRQRDDLERLDMEKLRAACKQQRIPVRTYEGKLVVERGGELSFLEILDRRRYLADLTAGEPEAYRASNRTRVAK